MPRGLRERKRLQAGKRNNMKPKRRAPRISTKRAVRKRQNDLCGCREHCGRELPPDGKGLVHYQHEPPLALRDILPDGSDWVPSQHDPDYLYAELAECHAKETYHPRSKATSLGSDRHAIDKTKRLRGELKPKPKKPWPSRKMESRPFPKAR
jgi:hypothetical protein